MPWFSDRAGAGWLFAYSEPSRVAFRTPLRRRPPGVYLDFAAQSPGLHFPLPTLQVHPYVCTHMTRGQHDWLFLCCMTLSFTAFCRLLRRYQWR